MEILGEELPADAMASQVYDGAPRMFVPTVRTNLTAGENLKLKIIILAGNQPKEAALHWRPMGKGEYEKVPLNHIARGVYSVTLPAERIGKHDFEYHIKIRWCGGEEVYFPASAPQNNQTVLVTGP